MHVNKREVDVTLDRVHKCSITEAVKEILCLRLALLRLASNLVWEIHMDSRSTSNMLFLYSITQSPYYRIQTQHMMRFSM